MTPPLRALLVEDSPADALLVRYALADLDFLRVDLAQAQRLREAIDLLQAEPFDIALLDLGLPDSEGLATLSALRAAAPDVPIVVLTGRADEALGVEVIHEGAQDYLVKGQIGPEILGRSLRYAVERRKGERRAEALNRELQQRVAELEQTRGELQAADRRKDEFLAMLAHELRNPLAPIRYALGLARQRERVPEGYAVIDRQVTHLARLVDDLLDVGRFNLGKLTLRSQRVPLAEVVEQALEIARPLIESHRHRVSKRLCAAPPVVAGDPARLVQVLSNLLANAARYTPPGGTIEVILEAEGDSAILRVRDDGIGIPPDKLSEVFELFSQLDRDVARTQGGLGVGLTLARDLVQLHGGAIEALSQGPGTGAEFIVRLPVVPGAAAPAPAPAPDEPSPQRRVLVVEDNEDGALMLSLFLQGLGCEVAVANTGHQALAAAQAAPPDLAFVDIGLPDLDGYEVARRLRASAETRAVRLVALTGYGAAEDVARGLAAGFDRYIVKPIDLDELERALREAPGWRA